jgi:hypothetical protein
MNLGDAAIGQREEHIVLILASGNRDCGHAEERMPASELAPQFGFERGAAG